MILAPHRNTPEWRAAHRGKVSASDLDAALARRTSKKYAALVERLVLDHEVPNHEDEHPDPWIEHHEQALVLALASYREYEEIDCEMAGLYASKTLPWLAASPHAVLEDCCVFLRPHTTLKAFYEKRGQLTPRQRARYEATMFVCERPAMDLVDVWDGLGEVDDRIHIRRIEHDYQWLSNNVFPRLVRLAEDVSDAIRIHESVSLRAC